MKKIFLSLAILATAMTTFASNDTKSTSAASCPQAEQTCCQKIGDCPDGRKFNFDRKENQSLFKGINLTEDQKTKLKALREKNKAQREQAKADCKNTCDKQKLTPEQKKQMRAEQNAKRQEARKAHLNDIKEILTADQYVIFLENNYLNAGKNGKSGMVKDGKRKAGKQFGKTGKTAKAQRADIMHHRKASKVADTDAKAAV